MGQGIQHISGQLVPDAWNISWDLNLTPTAVMLFLLHILGLRNYSFLQEKGSKGLVISRSTGFISISTIPKQVSDD